jgi:hypothetical protein
LNFPKRSFHKTKYTKSVCFHELYNCPYHKACYLFQLYKVVRTK